MSTQRFRIPNVLALAVGLAVVVLGAASSALAEPNRPSVGDETLMRALADELARSMEGLKLADLEGPYFLAYRVEDTHSHTASASAGGLLSSTSGRRRTLQVEIRVGSPELDNTNFFSPPSFGSFSMLSNPFGSTELPLEDDYLELRRQIWLATDAAYKQAHEKLAQKRAALETRTRGDELPDFRPLAPRQLEADGPELEVDLAAMETLVRELSVVLAEGPIYNSRVDFQGTTSRVHYLDSEGAAFVRTTPSVSLLALAETQADDGSRLGDHAAFYGRSVDGLPSTETLRQAVGAVATRIVERRSAEAPDRYNGPVLFTGEAAAAVFGQAFAPALIGDRRQVVGDERMARMFDAQAEAGDGFEDRIGGRVLPRSFSVVDDPTRDRLGEAPLMGVLAIDDDGRTTSPTTLIERGYLRTLLTDRTPLDGVENPTANRRGDGVLPTNLIVETSDGLDAAALREELMLLVADRGAEFGVVVERLVDASLLQGLSQGQGVRMIGGRGGGNEPAGMALAEARRVFPDGREELLGVVELVGLDAGSFKELVATGDAPNLLHRTMEPPRSPGSFRAARWVKPIVSLAVPDLLFEELTIKTPTGEIPRPPTYTAPGE